MASASFKVEDDHGREVEFVTFAVEFAFPRPRGKDAEQKLEQIERKLNDYCAKQNNKAN